MVTSDVPCPIVTAVPDMPVPIDTDSLLLAVSTIRYASDPCLIVNAVAELSVTATLISVSSADIESTAISPTLVMLPSPTLIAVALRVPANAVLAPVNVAAVVEPDLIIKLPELFVNAPYCVPSSFSNTSAPSASSIISPAASRVISPEDNAIVVPSMLKLSISIPASAVILPVEVSVPPTVVLPLMSAVPFISIAVAVRSISSVAPRERTVALEP